MLSLGKKVKLRAQTCKEEFLHLKSNFHVNLNANKKAQKDLFQVLKTNLAHK